MRDSLSERKLHGGQHVRHHGRAKLRTCDRSVSLLRLGCAERCNFLVHQLRHLPVRLCERVRRLDGECLCPLEHYALRELVRSMCELGQQLLV